MDWSQIANEPVTLGAVAGVVILLLLLWLILRRRKHSSTTQVLLTPQDLISQMGAYCPPFSAVMESYTSKRNLSDFLTQSDASGAFRELERFLQKKITSAAGQKKKALQIQFQENAPLDAETKGALVTIARCIYADQDYQVELNAKEQQEFDELLDFLT